MHRVHACAHARWPTVHMHVGRARWRLCLSQGLSATVELVSSHATTVAVWRLRVISGCRALLQAPFRRLLMHVGLPVREHAWYVHGLRTCARARVNTCPVCVWPPTCRACHATWCCAWLQTCVPPKSLLILPSAHSLNPQSVPRSLCRLLSAVRCGATRPAAPCAVWHAPDVDPAALGVAT